MSYTKMLAAVNTSLGKMELQEFEVPRVEQDGVLVEIRRAAICGSDLHSIYDGLGFLNSPDAAAPGKPGHEGVGVVIESRSADLQEGDHVLLLGFGTGGTFATHVAMPASECIKLAADEPLDRMLMAQQLGVSLYGMQRFWPVERPPAGATAAVIGAGSIGQFFIQLVRRWGFENVIVSDVEPDRIAAAARNGAQVTVLAPQESIVEATMAHTDGQGAELVVEAAGYDLTRAQAINSVRTGGRVGLFGYPEGTGNSEFPFADAFWKAPVSIDVAKGAQLVPGMPTFHEAISLIAKKDIELREHLGSEFGLEDIEEALETARARRAMKVQLVMGPG